MGCNNLDDVIEWKHFPRYWPFMRRIHRSPVNSPHKGQWRGALMFSLIWVWINGWVNNRKAGDLRRHRAHRNVIVMTLPCPRYLPLVSKFPNICCDKTYNPNNESMVKAGQVHSYQQNTFQCRDVEYRQLQQILHYYKALMFLSLLQMNNDWNLTHLVQKPFHLKFLLSNCT